ncbi:MAG TPA: exo-beta-N-acetylmuramidase NamZ domain-containing protein [Bryobacteraceae bacterium]|jgi:uncharacterized protein YbbC (DUF1343 family)
MMIARAVRLSFLSFLSLAALCAQSLPGAADVDAIIEQGIRDNRLPGAVLLVGHHGRVIYRKAYGNRALVPAVESMTLDTIFDCASLTKVVATTSAMMKLFEQGKVRIDDPVTNYLPEFQGGHSTITVRDLMTHYSGMPPDLKLVPAWSGYETGIRMALNEAVTNPPGMHFVYSDINFNLTAEIVHRVSGLMLNEFVQRNVFLPLGMKESMFLPPANLLSRIAPTEQQPNGEILRGVVHDPTARFMGGVAGDAGLFSTADDLSRFCQMMLNRGELDGVRVFQPLTVDYFTSPHSPPEQKDVRGLGWDIDSRYSGNRGELFPKGRSYGHTGFTGTSIWIDPVSQTYVILLANTVHPRVRPAMTSVRGRVATTVAANVGYEGPPPDPLLRTGLDVMVDQQFRLFQGKRVGLITNQTGIDRHGRRNIDLMLEAGVKVVALFSPEHGIEGTEDRENLGGTTDPRTGIKVYSLYEGANRRPKPEMLKGLDALVFDIADIGVRFYTYETTMAYCMEDAAKAHVPYYVFDRPNPLTGIHVEGPVLSPANESFIGYFPLPVRHGMTIGELARLFNSENGTNANLTVVPMLGWRRAEWFDATGAPWVNPSPNIRNLNAGLLYPGIAMLEGSENYSVGRGTDSPFEWVGAEFIHGRELAAYLNQRLIPGLRAYPVRFKPESSHLKGKTIEGIRFVVTNRDVFDAGRFGVELAAALQYLYPGKMVFTADRKLIGSAAVVEGLTKGASAAELLKVEREELARFGQLREKYLLYR